ELIMLKVAMLREVNSQHLAKANVVNRVQGANQRLLLCRKRVPVEQPTQPAKVAQPAQTSFVQPNAVQRQQHIAVNGRPAGVTAVLPCRVSYIIPMEKAARLGQYRILVLDQLFEQEDMYCLLPKNLPVGGADVAVEGSIGQAPPLGCGEEIFKSTGVYRQ